jgi:pyrroline-5-carboxylate reductase
MSHQLGFIGAGNMAEAIVRATINSQILPASQIIACDVNQSRRDLFASLGVSVTQTTGEVVSQAKPYVLLAVKPQQLGDVAAELAKHITADHVIISIMAGITSAKLASAITSARAAAGLSDDLKVRIIRVMPNTPLMSGLGMAGISLGEHAKPGDETMAQQIFGAGDNKAVIIPESQMDALTAVSGSGPAYVFYLAEAMEKAANELGLKDHARQLVAQTILGSAHLLASSPDTPAELRRKVTSPGGTTEAAVRHMDGNKTIDVVVNAIKAAQKRSKELGA